MSIRNVAATLARGAQRFGIAALLLALPLAAAAQTQTLSIAGNPAPAASPAHSIVPTDWPQVYAALPTLTGDATLPVVNYSKQASNILVQPAGSMVLVTVWVNLRWDNIVARGSKFVYLGNMPPSALGPAGTEYCDWSGNFAGITFPAGGSLSFDTSPGTNEWFFVISSPTDVEKNLLWTAVGFGTGRVRGRLTYLADPVTLANWLNSGIATGNVWVKGQSAQAAQVRQQRAQAALAAH